MNDTRKEGRLPVTLLARYREPTMLEPREGECRDLSPGGMFIMTPRPSPRGALIRFECASQISEESFRGTGRVVWQRNKTDPRGIAGMGIRFVRLESGSREALQRIVERVQLERQRSRAESGRRTSSGPPPRVRSGEVAEQQPVPILNAPGDGGAAPTTPPPAEAEPKSTLRGIGARAGATDRKADLRSPVPPPWAEQKGFASTLPQHSPLPPAADGSLSSTWPSASGRSESSPLPPPHTPMPPALEPAPAPTLSAPPRGQSDPAGGASRDRLDRTRRGVGPSPMPPPAGIPSDRMPTTVMRTADVTVKTAETRAVQDSAKPAGGNGGGRPARAGEGMTGAAPRSSIGERPSFNRISDRPPGPGGIDDLRSQRGPLPVKPTSTGVDASKPIASKPDVDVSEATTTRGHRSPFVDVPSRPSMRSEVDVVQDHSLRPLWFVLASGVVVSIALVWAFGGAPAELSPGAPSPSDATQAEGAMPSPAPVEPSVPPQVLGTAPPVVTPQPPTPERPPGADMRGSPHPSPSVHAEPEPRSARTPERPSEPPSPVVSTPHEHAAPSSARATPRPTFVSPRDPTKTPEGATSTTSGSLSVRPSTAPAPTSELAPVEPPKAAQGPRDLPSPERGATQTPLQQALECLSRGDNHCVIRALADKASTPREIELLVATYRTVGDGPRAEREMKHYIESFPSGPRVPEYKHILERQRPVNGPATPANP